MVRRVGQVAVSVALLASACSGGDDTATDEAQAPRTEIPFGLQRCPDEFETITADPDAYRDEPVYVGNEQPRGQIQRWARNQPGFQEVWIDRDHNGWLVVGFTEQADRRQAELERQFPDVGVVAVEVPASREELRALHEQARDASDRAGIEASSSYDVPYGVVAIYPGVLSEERLASLASFADDRLCVAGLDPADAPTEGPQPEGGDGWRLLGEHQGGPPGRTGVATTRAQYEAIWAESDLDGDPPEVDFEIEIVVWFGAVYGSGCQIRLDDIVFDATASLVSPDLVAPDEPLGCHSDANPHSFVVAVQRAALPSGPFVVALVAADEADHSPEARTAVAVDLTRPGSTATDAEIGPDEETLAAAREH